ETVVTVTATSKYKGKDARPLSTNQQVRIRPVQTAVAFAPMEQPIWADMQPVKMELQLLGEISKLRLVVDGKEAGEIAVRNRGTVPFEHSFIAAGAHKVRAEGVSSLGTVSAELDLTIVKVPVLQVARPAANVTVRTVLPVEFALASPDEFQDIVWEIDKDKVPGHRVVSRFDTPGDKKVTVSARSRHGGTRRFSATLPLTVKEAARLEIDGPEDGIVLVKEAVSFSVRNHTAFTDGTIRWSLESDPNETTGIRALYRFPKETQYTVVCNATDLNGFEARSRVNVMALEPTNLQIASPAEGKRVYQGEKVVFSIRDPGRYRNPQFLIDGYKKPFQADSVELILEEPAAKLQIVAKAESLPQGDACKASRSIAVLRSELTVFRPPEGYRQPVSKILTPTAEAKGPVVGIAWEFLDDDGKPLKPAGNPEDGFTFPILGKVAIQARGEVVLSESALRVESPLVTIQVVPDRVEIAVEPQKPTYRFNDQILFRAATTAATLQHIRSVGWTIPGLEQRADGISVAHKFMRRGKATVQALVTLDDGSTQVCTAELQLTAPPLGSGLSIKAGKESVSKLMLAGRRDTSGRMVRLVNENGGEHIFREKWSVRRPGGAAWSPVENPGGFKVDKLGAYAFRYEAEGVPDFEGNREKTTKTIHLEVRRPRDMVLFAGILALALVFIAATAWWVTGNAPEGWIVYSRKMKDAEEGPEEVVRKAIDKQSPASHYSRWSRRSALGRWSAWRKQGALPLSELLGKGSPLRDAGATDEVLTLTVDGLSYYRKRHLQKITTGTDGIMAYSLVPGTSP
ncbi:MAG: hypothetical protein HN341_03605, partial [Verrucomicrobia bacterium]|nr:hypothetical protein [Verrucomicrobiota bacterium]